MGLALGVQDVKSTRFKLTELFHLAVAGLVSP
jgi:hypothetical protein